MVAEKHIDSKKLVIALFDCRNWVGCSLFSVDLIRVKGNNKIIW